MATITQNVVRISFSRFLPVCNNHSNKKILNGCRLYSDIATNQSETKEKISKAMVAYLKRAKAYEEFIQQEQHQFNVGRRHLANMMGVDAESFTQEDIDGAIKYLLPSALYEPKARPIMKPPQEVFPKTKDAEFDKTGRPYHYLFYTTRPNYISLVHECADVLKSLDAFEDKMVRQQRKPDPEQTINFMGSEWLKKEAIEKLVLEKLVDIEYEKLVDVMERISSHPYAYRVKDFIFQYRIQLMTDRKQQDDLERVDLDDGRQSVTFNECIRKSARGKVTVTIPGTGKFSINGKGIAYFKQDIARQQMDLNKPHISRAKSFQPSGPEAAAETMAKYKTATPNLLTRLRLGTIKRKPNRDIESSSSSSSSSDSGNATPLDDLICLESFEELSSNGGVARIDITKEAIRAALLYQLSSNGCQRDVFSDTDFQNFTYVELNVALLAAAASDRCDLLDELVKLPFDFNYYETKYGFGAVHVAAFFGSAAFCRQLLLRGASATPNSGIYSPLHCAALAGHADVVELLVGAGAAVDLTQPAGETALSAAVRMNSISCVQALVEAGADVNAVDNCGCAPLHVACDLGLVAVVKWLLESGRCDLECRTPTEQNTPLHLATQGAFFEIVELLLNGKASPNAANSRMKTPLHLATRVCLESSELLLKKGADPNAEDVEKRTPLHVAVAKSEVRFGPDTTKLLLSWGAAVNSQDRYGYTPLHIAALNELTDCTDALVRHGADITARTKGGTVVLGILARKTPSTLAAIRDVLDSYISCNDPEVSYRQVRLSFNFKYILQGCERGEMNFLQTVVNEGQRALLEHPLCEAFLHLKWQKIRKYYAARLAFCCMFVVLFSLYVMIVLAYQCYEVPKDPLAYSNRINLVHPIQFNYQLCSNKSSVMAEWLRANPHFVEYEWFVLAIFTVLEVLRKIYGLNGYTSFRQYWSLSNIVEWLVVASVPPTAYHFMSQSNITWQNHIGAFAVLIGWANLMVMIGHLPMFGSYVAMYTKVQKEFAKLLSAYICLLIGFTISFCAIFVKADAFKNPFIGFIKILVMMTGEFEFGNLLTDIEKAQDVTSLSSLLQASALVTFVLFLLFVTIILINLLIGIAVHDIQGLQKTAGLSKLVGLTNLISHIEAALFGPKVPGCMVRVLSTSSGIQSLLTVNPLNSREQRLPKEILRAGLEIVRQKRGKRPAAEERRLAFSTRQADTIGDAPTSEIVDAVSRLSEEVRELKQLLLTRVSSDIINNEKTDN